MEDIETAFFAKCSFLFSILPIWWSYSSPASVLKLNLIRAKCPLNLWKDTVPIYPHACELPVERKHTAYNVFNIKTSRNINHGRDYIEYMTMVYVQQCVYVCQCLLLYWECRRAAIRWLMSPSCVRILIGLLLKAPPPPLHQMGVLKEPHQDWERDLFHMVQWTPPFPMEKNHLISYNEPECRFSINSM